MTRINANIEPIDLIDQHLIAEYREIVRIPNHVLKYPIDLNSIPFEYVLGIGHVKYFYNKILFLHHRFISLKTELTKRNIVNNMDDSSFIQVQIQKPELYQFIKLDTVSNYLVAQRIVERILTMKKTPKYLGMNIINVDDYICSFLQKYQINSAS